MWEIDKSYSICNEFGSHYKHEEINIFPPRLYFVYKGTDVWSLVNGRCRPITTARFERLLRKALKFAQGKGYINSFGHWRMDRDNGSDSYLVAVCQTFLKKLNRIGLYKQHDFVVPGKFTDKQIAFAIQYYGEIRRRVEIVEEYYGKTDCKR